MAELKTTKAQFATAIAEVETTATANWDAATKIAEEEPKAEAMAAVNAMVKESCVYFLTEIPNLMDAIKATSDKFTGKRMSKTLLSKVEDARKLAFEKIDKAHSAIDAGAADAASAKTLLEPHYDALFMTKAKLNGLWTAYKKEQKKKK